VGRRFVDGIGRLDFKGDSLAGDQRRYGGLRAACQQGRRAKGQNHRTTKTEDKVG